MGLRGHLGGTARTQQEDRALTRCTMTLDFGSSTGRHPCPWLTSHPVRHLCVVAARVDDDSCIWGKVFKYGVGEGLAWPSRSGQVTGTTGLAFSANSPTWFPPGANG